MFDLDGAFDLFIKEKTYLSNCSPNSIRYFRSCYSTYCRFVGREIPTREVLSTLVVRMRESGMSAGCCNTYIKGINTRLCRELEIKPEGFHCFRRTFARNYLKSGGNFIYLQVAMGHSRVETTRGYVEVETEDLQRTHFRTSILSRLR